MGEKGRALQINGGAKRMPYKDPEDQKEYFRGYYLRNKERVLAKNRAWALVHPERAREIDKKHYLKSRQAGLV